MTDQSAFHEAFVAFRHLPYPDYPKTEKLQLWNSDLLLIDTFMGGYATQVAHGVLRADEVPDLDRNIADVERLVGDLDALRDEPEAAAGLREQYRVYASTLLRMMQEMKALTNFGS